MSGSYSVSHGLRRLLKWLGKRTWRPSWTGEKSQTTHRRAGEWREYEYLDPRDADEHAGHDCAWTRAPGVWTCRTCHEWYRTWKDTPRKDHRQSDRVGFP